MEQAITDMVRQCTAAMEQMSTMMGDMGGMGAGTPSAMAAGGPMMPGDGWWLALAVIGVGLAIGAAAVIAGVARRRAAAASMPGDGRGELDLRYARGEITRQTYLQQRADLVAGAAG